MVRKKGKAAIHPLSPARITAGSFLLVIITGTLLLMLPFSSKGEPLSFLTSLFTATSATCVTGLTLIDPYTHLTFFGQLVLLSMIEIGGIGLVTFSCFFMAFHRARLSSGEVTLASPKTWGIRPSPLSGPSLSKAPSSWRGAPTKRANC